MLRLDEDLLQAVLVLVELVVDLIQVLETDAVRHHLQRIELALLDLLHELVPVLVDWSLTIANEADTTLHQRADVEVVGLSMVLVLEIMKLCKIERGLDSHSQHIHP